MERIVNIDNEKFPNLKTIHAIFGSAGDVFDVPVIVNDRENSALVRK